MKNRRAGFALIELLIVVVVLGILATIAIPKFSAMREKSYIAAVTSDLKNLASQQEIYLSDNHEYAPGVRDLDLIVTDNVVLSVNEATGVGRDRDALRARGRAMRDLLRVGVGDQRFAGDHRGHRRL